MDVIVLCTGFSVADDVIPFPVIGRNGLTLANAWKDGMEAYLGATVHGFPNLYFIVGPNTGLGHNSMIFMIEAQVQYVMGALKWQRKNGARSLEVCLWELLSPPPPSPPPLRPLLLAYSFRFYPSLPASSNSPICTLSWAPTRIWATNR